MNSKPYIDILLELGYHIEDDEFETTYDSENPDEEDVYVVFSPTFGHPNKYACVKLDLEAEGSTAVRNYFKDKDYTKLELTRLEAYWFDGERWEDCDGRNNLVFFRVSTRLDDSGIQDIKRVTPDLFRTILKIKESREAELEHSHKILQRYLDAYYNIIVPIVNPVAEMKHLWYDSTLVTYGFNATYTANRNIELEYFGQDYILKFVIGIDYITGKLYSYFPDSSNLVMDDFDLTVTTKGKMLELLKEHGI